MVWTSMQLQGGSDHTRERIPLAIFPEVIVVLLLMTSAHQLRHMIKADFVLIGSEQDTMQAPLVPGDC